MTRILIVEDDPVIRETLDYNLTRAGFSVLLAGDGAQGLSMLRRERPDLILLDILLPQADGFRLCEKIREADERTPILMVTALSEESDKVRGLDCGADDYITKPFGTEELIARVRANLRRARTAPSGAKAQTVSLRHGDLVIEPDNFAVSMDGRPISLRLKEFQLLALLAGNPGKVFTRRELAEKVWGYDFVAGRTIDVHIRRIREKIEEHSGYVYVRTVHGVGYRFEVGAKQRASED